VEPHHFGRERQEQDRNPAGDHTELRDVIVRITAVIRRLGTRIAQVVGKAILALGSGDIERIPVIPNGRVAVQLWLNAPRTP
jgi:hypothetical protein